MGSNAALMAARVIENTFEVLAVQSLALADAVDALAKEDKLSPGLKDFYTGVRKATGKTEVDMPRFKELARIKDFLKANTPGVIN